MLQIISKCFITTLKSMLIGMAWHLAWHSIAYCNAYQLSQITTIFVQQIKMCCLGFLTKNAKNPDPYIDPYERY